MNHTFRLVWNKQLNMLVAVAENVRSQGKSAGGETSVAGGTAASSVAGAVAKSGRKFLGKLRIPILMGMMALGQISPALAHTDALGWIINPDTNNVGNFLVDIYYGSWHAGGVGAEGSLDLSGPNSFSANAVFSMVPGYTNVSDGTLAPGLTLGVNYFFPNGSGGFDATSSGGVFAFQSASFSNLTAGAYTFGYHAGALSAVWTPSDAAINAGSFTIGAGGTIVVVGAGPVADNIDEHAPFQLNSGLGTTVNPVFEGGTLKIDAAGSVTQNFTVAGKADGTQSSTIDQNGNASNFTGVLSDASGPGSLTITNGGSGGSVTFSGVNTYTGTTTIDSGATLALSGSGSIATSSGVVDNGSLDISGTTSGAAITTLSGSGRVALGSETLTLSNASTTFSGAIGGTGGVTVSAGTETLTGANTYSGATNVNGGTLTLSGSGSLASTSVNVAAGATLNDSNGGLASGTNLTDDGAVTLGTNQTIANLNGTAGAATLALGSNTLTVSSGGSYAGHISGTGGVTVSGGTETLTGTSTYSGTTTINSGATLVLGAGGSVANSAIADAGTLTLTASSSAKSLSGAGGVNLNANTLTLNTASGTYSGVMNGTGGLTIAAGTETLTGTNTFTGATTINSGATLALTGSGSVAASSGVADNGSFDITGTTTGATVKTLSGNGSVALGTKTLTLSNASTTFSGAIGGTGGVTVAAGTETLTGANTYSGTTTVNSGATLVLGAGGSAANSAIADAGTLTLTASSSAKSLSGAGGVNLNANTLTLSNASGSYSGVMNGTGGLTVAAGTETLTGTNTFTGATTINSGATLALTGSGSVAAASGVVDNGSFNISGTTAGATVKTLSGNGTVALGSKTLTLSNASTTFSGAIGGTGGVTVAAGTETLTGANTYSGTTTINSGATLALSGAGTIANSSGLIGNGSFNISGTTAGSSITTLAGSGNVVLGTKTLTLTAAADTYSGSIAGTGGVTVSGGTQTLSGTNTYTGETTVTSGATLKVSADANLGASTGGLTLNNGTLESTGSFTTTRNMTLAGNGTFNTNDGTTLTNTTGTIAGAGALIKNGAGTLVLGGVASHTGGTVVNAGTLELSGANTYTGGTALNGGTLKVSTDNNLGAASSDLTFTGGSLQSTGTFSTARNVTLNSAGGTLSTDTSTTLTLNGTLTGSGTITKTGTGTLILAGDNSGAPSHTPGTGWTGGLDINAGLVQVTNPWGLGWGDVIVHGGTINTTVNILTGQTIALAGGTTVNTDLGTTTTLSGTISTAADTGGGTACFTKSGTGTLNVTGSATLSNGTCVEQGLLLANGTLTSDVTVNPGATLGGAGVIHGAINVQGTLSPGNSPGFLTATSTVTMLSGSTFQDDIAGTTQASASSPIGAYGYYSALHVTGNNQFVINPNATLSPMLKNIFSASEAGFTLPSFVPSIGQTFRIVTADGGISGRFSTLTQPDGLASGTRFAAFYNVFDSNSIDLKVLPTSYAQWLGGSNRNTISAANALDQILNIDQAGNGTSAQDQLLYVTASKSEAELPGFVKGLAGEVHGALAAVVPLSGQWLQGSVARRLGSAVGSDSAADQSDLTPGKVLWVDLATNKGNWSADNVSSGFTNTSTHFALGMDVLSKGDSRFGFGISHTNSNVTADIGSGAVDESMGFAYGQLAYGNYLVDGLVGYGTSTTTSQRGDPTGLTGTLKSNQDSRNALVSAGIRTSWNVGSTTLEPFARVMWQHTSRDAFSEGTAVAALSFTDYSASGVRSMAGISGSSKTKDPLAAPNTYQFSLALGQDSGDLVHPVVNASLAGINTQIAAPEAGRTFVQANLSGTARLGKLAYGYAGITGEARSGKSDLGVNVGVRISF